MRCFCLIEIYVPTETTDDDLFKSGITSGINFDRFDKIPVNFLAIFIDTVIHPQYTV